LIKSVRAAATVEDDEALQRLQADLGKSAGVGLDKVLAEEDPREAIIAAYAHMESALGAHGFPRDKAQTPVEYMEATLRQLDAVLRRISHGINLPRRALLTLTRLYEVAKFSLHELTSTDRDTAIQSLRDVEASAAVVGEPEATT
jgi:hypothetical protein